MGQNMASELLIPPSRALDANANPYAGAKWYFYQSGTLTPQSVFTTAALNVAHANPVIADAGGKFANIFFNAALTYRGVLKDASDTITLHDIDPINDGTLSRLAASSGSSLVGFLQAGAGAVARTGQAKMRDVVSVMDFGAVGDGVANDAASIQSAIDAVSNGGKVIFPQGKVFKINSELAVANRTNITFSGDNALIKGGATRIRSYFYLSGCTGIAFDGLQFDQLQPSLPTYTVGDYGNLYNCAIYAGTTDGLKVTNCTFTNLYTSSIFFYTSSNLIVDKCVFTSAVQVQNQWLQFVHLGTYGGNNIITRSRFENAVTTNPSTNPCAVYVSGGSNRSAVTISNNIALYCGRDNAGTHRLGVFDIYGDAQNVLITDNVSSFTMSQFSRLSSVRNGKIKNNRITMSASAELDYSVITVESVIVFSPGQVGAQDVEVSGNVIEDLSGRAAFAIGVLSYDWGAPSTAIKVLGNSFIGARRAVIVQGPFNDVQIIGNHSRLGRGSIEVGHNGTNASQVTATIGTEANSRFDNCVIANNVIINDSGNEANPITISLSKTPAYSGSVGRVSIRNNSFRKAGTVDSGQAIAVSLTASALQGRLLIEGNETNNYTYDWYVRGTQEVIIRGNRALNTATAAYLDDGTNGTLVRSGNRLSTGALQGTATLVAGTSTVNTAEIRTGDTVILSRQAAGGTLGVISVGTITNATSFVINSNNAADTSAVFWRIEH